MIINVNIDGVDHEINLQENRDLVDNVLQFAKPEINQRIVTAVKNEKSKVYSKIDALEKENYALKTAAATSPSNNPVSNDPAEDGVNVTKPNTNDSATTASQNNVSMEESKKIEDIVAARLEDAVAPLKALLESQRTESLRKYREAKISAAQGNIIESLVTGNTEQEIDASFEVAKAEFEKLAAKFANPNPQPAPPAPAAAAAEPTPAPAPTPNPNENGGITPPAPMHSPTQNTVVQTVPVEGQPFVPIPSDPRPHNPAYPANPVNLNVKGMTDEEYARHRDRLFAEAENSFKMAGAN